MKNWVCASVLAAAGLLPLASQAADEFTEAMQKAYAPYRVALYKTNGKSQAESRDAVAMARVLWADVTLRYAVAPPSPYAGDPQLKGDCAKVDAIYAQAAEEIEQNKLAPAHETLEGVRDILADLRRRNGVVTFSDHMNAYHSEMEHLIDDGPGLLAQEKGQLRLMARVGTLHFLARRLDSEASAVLKANAEFAELVPAVLKSVADLEAAALVGDAAGVKQALGGLKKPYSRLFMKFG